MTKQEAESEKKLNAYFTSVALLAEKIGSLNQNRKKGEVRTGTIKCPICKKIIHYEIHSNEHIWAKCETKDCISFME